MQTEVFVLLAAYLQASILLTTPWPASRSVPEFHLPDSAPHSQAETTGHLSQPRQPRLSFCFCVFISIICLSCQNHQCISLVATVLLTHSYSPASPSAERIVPWGRGNARLCLPHRHCSPRHGKAVAKVSGVGREVWRGTNSGTWGAKKPLQARGDI